MLLVAGLLVAMGLVAGYMEVSERADRMLALRQGPPAAVALQDFSHMRNTGPADEVRVFAEVDLSDPLILPLRGSDPEQRAYVVPLFPVSAEGAEVISSQIQGGDGQSAEVITDMAIIAQDKPPALGVLVFILPAYVETVRDTSMLLAERYGEGRFGEVVELNGESTSASAFQRMIDGAFAAKNLTLIDGYLAIAPYAEGRLAALSAPRVTGSHRILYAVALFLVVIAAVVSLREGSARRRAAANAAPRPPAETIYSDFPSSDPRFQAIPTQEEIAQAHKVNAAPKPIRFQLALNWLGRQAGAAQIMLRNRRPHREDEAL
ncbi:MAG: hypothetical protein HKN63_03705 [Rhodobacteraceae bacterium]|nr:hypothetical protein [Paracoccaceae bacterium]